MIKVRKKYQVEISYMDKPTEVRTLESTDNTTALMSVLNSLNLEENDNVLGVKITYIGE